MSSTILQGENEFKNMYSKTYTRRRLITNKAHEYRNRFNLGKPIKIGRKVLLENHAKGLLKSKKLLELRSGLYTVTKQITNTTYEIVHDSTEQKKVVHRNHLVEYFPKEQEIDKLVQDYSTNYDDYYHSFDYYYKFDYYQYTNFRRLQLSEINTIQQICELERSLKNTQLAYSRLSPKLAGFLLTNNRSMFLETNGNISWLYQSPKFYSPLQVMDTCYNRIPVLYKNKARFIDPVSRQTFTTAEQQPCNNKQKNFFQLDIENDNSWIELTPSITQFTGPAIFAPSNQKHKMV